MPSVDISPAPYQEWIPAALKALRGEKPQKQIAKDAGISLPYYNTIEKGVAIPTIEVLSDIFRAGGTQLVLSYAPNFVPNDYVLISKREALLIVNALNQKK